MAKYASFNDGGLPDKLRPCGERNPDLYREGTDTALPVRVDGLILSVTGLSGLTVGLCTVTFDRELVTLVIGNSPAQVRLQYSDITSLQAGGRGDVVTTSGGGWTAGAIFPADLGGRGSNPTAGIENAAAAVFESVVITTVLNKLTTIKKHRIETIFHLAWAASGSVTLLNSTLRPVRWGLHSCRRYFSGSIHIGKNHPKPLPTRRKVWVSGRSNAGTARRQSSRRQSNAVIAAALQ